MRLVLISALLFACAVAGPIDRGSLSPGGTLGLSGYWNSDPRVVSVTGAISPGLEYAIDRGVFLGANVSLAGGFTSCGDVPGYSANYAYIGLGPSARVCLAPTPPWPFVRLQSTVSVQITSNGQTQTESTMRLAGSVGLLSMLSHGVATETALSVEWLGTNRGLSFGIGMGLRSFIYK